MDRSPAHLPVLKEAVLELLSPSGRRVLLDCTVGLGGHAEALLEAAGQDAQLIGIDLDEGNLRLTKDRLARFGGRVRLFQASFSDAGEVLAEAGVAAADVVLADLGVSSNQLDEPGRGFCFSADGPLDMRMDRGAGRTAGELVGTLGEKELADVIYEYGQERFSRRIARAIVAARGKEPIESTARLARIVAGAMPAPVRRTRKGVHPATRTFQALRIAVNDELGRLDALLASLGDLMAPGGRAAIISFHSLEDRRVKHAFADMRESGRFRLLTRRPITAAEDEIANNPRSRSAKLRGIERIT